MLHQEIKDATRLAHQQLEKTVVGRIKAIRSEQDYADFLKYFYAYFRAVEEAIAPFITSDVLPDYLSRRNSSYLKDDIEALGGSTTTLPVAVAPAINGVAQAMGALYVLEGSIMGGPFIVKMLQKYGLSKGFSFFAGYGEETGARWQVFTQALDKVAATDDEKQQVLAKSTETFSRFGEVFAFSVDAP